MQMHFDDNDLKEIWVTTSTNINPATATLHLAIDGTEYACTWQGAAVENPAGNWTRLAHTTGMFAGPAVAAGEVGGATVLAAGSHETETRLRVGGRIIAGDTQALNVG